LGNQRWKSTNEDFQKYLRLVRAGDKELYKKHKRKIYASKTPYNKLACWHFDEWSFSSLIRIWLTGINNCLKKN